MSSSSSIFGVLTLVGASLLVMTVPRTGAATSESSVTERGAAAARAAAAKRATTIPNVAVPEYDRARVKELSEHATRRGAAELERLRAGQGWAGAMDHGGPNGAATQGRSAVAGRVVVALSASMPEAMLTSYFAQLDGKPESLAVLRGFVGGARTVRPTGLLMERVRRRVAGDPKAAHYQVETVVDPLLFRQLGIEQVPAVIWLAGVQSLAHCDEEDYSTATVIYGAASIEAALREARKAGANVPETVIAKYRGTGWQHKAP